MLPKLTALEKNNMLTYFHQKAHKATTLLLMLNLFAPPSTYAQTLTDKIDNLIAKELPNAAIGILIQDATTGRVVYSKNKNTLLMPASGIKLLPSVAALYYWKPNHRFETSLSEKNKNLYLTFVGDPSLSIEKLESLLLQLEKHHIRTIEGDIVLDTSRFTPPYYPDGASFDDLGWYYTTPDTAAILNENMEAYQFTSAKNLGERIQITPKTEKKALTLINQVSTVSEDDAKEHCNLNIELRPNNTLRLFGCLAEATDKTMKLAVPEPILFAKQTVKHILDKRHIILKGKMIEGHAPKDAKHIASIQSDDLTQIVAELLQNSNNLYASSLTKQLGYALTQEGSYKQGTFAIKKLLTKHTKLDNNQLVLSDGVGTRYNLITAEQLVTLLTNIYHNKNLYPIALQALAQSGVSGTLQDRFKDTPLEKKVFAKTGTMHDVSSLSGYLIQENGNPLIFSILINGINKPNHVGRVLEDKILLAVYNNIAQVTAQDSQDSTSQY